MKKAYKYSPEGQYMEDVIVFPDVNGKYNLPQNCTWNAVPQPCWKPIIKNGKWTETATETEKNPPKVLSEKSPIEKKLDLIQKALDDLIFGGGF